MVIPIFVLHNTNIGMCAFVPVKSNESQNVHTNCQQQLYYSSCYEEKDCCW